MKYFNIQYYMSNGYVSTVSIQAESAVEAKAIFENNYTGIFMSIKEVENGEFSSAMEEWFNYETIEKKVVYRWENDTCGIDDYKIKKYNVISIDSDNDVALAKDEEGNVVELKVAEFGKTFYNNKLSVERAGKQFTEVEYLAGGSGHSVTMFDVESIMRVLGGESNDVCKRILSKLDEEVKCNIYYDMSSMLLDANKDYYIVENGIISKVRVQYRSINMQRVKGSGSLEMLAERRLVFSLISEEGMVYQLDSAYDIGSRVFATKEKAETALAIEKEIEKMWES